MSTIVITEKPSVAQEYIKVLGVHGNRADGYVEGHSDLLGTNVIVTWAVGHLVGISSPKEQNPDWDWKTISNDTSLLPMIPSHFKYKPIDSTAKQFETVKKLYKRTDIDTIYYAGDSGREGIYIQALIRDNIFRSAPSNINEKVVWIDSFTDEEIKRGIREAKPYSEYENMVKSGYARAITDWLIGMNFTTAFTITSRSKIVTGRVVTPTLAMVVKRQKEIDSFVKTDYYGVKAQLDSGEAFWEAVKGSRFFESIDLYNENGFLKEQNAINLINEFNSEKTLKITDVNTQKKTEYAPYLFNQTDLQAYCSKTFHISPADTLASAQRLYEKKYTTYPRTSARVISTAVAKDLQKKGYNVPPKYVDDSKIVDHYAIIPTFEGDPNSLSGIDKQVYDAIYKRFMDTMKPPYEYNAITVTYQHSNGEFFFEKFKNIIQKGWRDNISDSEMIQKPIPSSGNLVNVKAFSIRNMETTPPSAYTTGSLVKEMEKAGKFIDDDELRAQIKSCGIGTDATRAGIVQKLVDTGYITVDKKQKVSPTDVGKKVVEIIEKYDEQLVSPIKTADLETNLSEIVDNQLDYNVFLKNIEEYVASTTKRIVATNSERINTGGTNGPIGKCPKCGADVQNGKFGFYCTAKCGMNIAKVYGKVLTETQVKNLLSGKEISYTVNGKKTTVKPVVTENEYQGKIYYNWATGDNNGATVKSNKVHSCPCCGKDLKAGRFNWSCECGFSFSYEICGHKMTEKDLEDFIANGETKVYSFKSKAGKKFNAKLVLDDTEHKTKFEFDK